MRKGNSLRRISIFLFLDFFLTGIIAFLAALNFTTVVVWVRQPEMREFHMQIYSRFIELEGLFFGTLSLLESIFSITFKMATGLVPTPLLLPTSIISVYFYATFFTSIWVWLFAISCVVLNVSIYSGVRVIVIRLKKRYDIRKQPYFSISLIMMQIITFIFIILAPFLLRSQNP